MPTHLEPPGGEEDDPASSHRALEADTQQGAQAACHRPGDTMTANGKAQDNCSVQSKGHQMT